MPADLFDNAPPTIADTTPCRCGANAFIAEPGSGPHHKHLRCSQCGRGGRWQRKPTPNHHADLFEDWLKTHPAPNLQKLVDHWGGYEKIPQVAWDDFDRQNRDWESARLDRCYGHHTWALRNDLNQTQGRPSRKK